MSAPLVDPYRGLFDVPYVMATIRVLATTLALGGLIFLVLPRRAGATRNQGAPPMSRHLTGFDEEVQLGQLGEILENDTVVMTVELTDEEGETIQPVGEPLWRGVTMLRYDKGRWHRQAKPTQSVVSFKTAAPPITQDDPPENQARAERLGDPIRHAPDAECKIGSPVRTESLHERRHALSARSAGERL